MIEGKYGLIAKSTVPRCVGIQHFKFIMNADHMHDIQMVYIEEAKLSDIGDHICLPDISCDLATGCVYTGSAGIVSIFNKFTWFGDYWNMVLEIFDKHFTVDGPCIRNHAIVFVWACLSRQRSPVFGQILINVYLGIRILVDILQGWFGAKDTLSHFSCDKLYNNLSMLPISHFAHSVTHRYVMWFHRTKRKERNTAKQ